MNKSIISLCLITAASLVFGQTTLEKYGRNIIYYDLSKIPFDSLTLTTEIRVPDDMLDRKIPLPKDLKDFFDNNPYNPRLQNPQEFEQLFWEEAAKLGFTADKFKKMGPRRVIEAIVKVVGARITYFKVDGDTSFIKEHGKHLPIETYFRLGLGDCDKYRDATMAAFQIVKPLNPKLQNVYLSREGLGGNIDPYVHAWVSIIIPRENQLILSHIDPTFYDNKGSLEAYEYHVTLKNDIFLGYFYAALGGCENTLYAYQIFEKAIPKTMDKKKLEKNLNRMACLAREILKCKDKSELALEKFLPVFELYDKKKFTDNLDDLLYYGYEICSKAGKQEESEKYKERLLKEFPDSFWAKSINGG